MSRVRRARLARAPAGGTSSCARGATPLKPALQRCCATSSPSACSASQEAASNIAAGVWPGVSPYSPWRLPNVARGNYAHRLDLEGCHRRLVLADLVVRDAIKLELEGETPRPPSPEPTTSRERRAACGHDSAQWIRPRSGNRACSGRTGWLGGPLPPAQSCPSSLRPVTRAASRELQYPSASLRSRWRPTH